MDYNALCKELEDDFGPTIDPVINFWLPTGTTLVDACLRGSRIHIPGGLPGGQIVEVAGEEQSGKTAWVMGIIAQALAMGGGCMWCDCESRFDETLADLVKLNYKSPHFHIFRPGCLEEFLGGAVKAFRRRRSFVQQASIQKPKGIKKAGVFLETPFVVVLDSLASLGPRKMNLADMSKEDWKALPMLIASLWSDFFRNKVIREMGGTNMYLVIINQARTDVNFFVYGPPDIRSPGGKAVKHACSVRLRLESQGLHINDKKGENKEAPIGQLMHVRVLKVGGPPRRRVYVPYFYHLGFDDGLSCLNYLIGKGYIRKKSGGYIIIDGEQRRKAEWRKKFYEDSDFREKVKQWTRDAHSDECSYQDSDTAKVEDELDLDDEE